MNANSVRSWNRFGSWRWFHYYALVCLIFLPFFCTCLIFSLFLLSEHTTCCLYIACSSMPTTLHPSMFFCLAQTPLVRSLSIMKGNYGRCIFLLMFSAWHQQRETWREAPQIQGRPLTNAYLVSTRLVWNTHKMVWAHASNTQRSWSTLCRSKIRALLRSMCCASVSVNFLVSCL